MGIIIYVLGYMAALFCFYKMNKNPEYSTFPLLSALMLSLTSWLVVIVVLIVLAEEYKVKENNPFKKLFDWFENKKE